MMKMHGVSKKNPVHALIHLTDNNIFFQLKRYKTYVYLIQSRLTAYPELEPSLVETVIGEDEESVTVGQPSHRHPVQRSLSDRYSYRAAIYNNEHSDYQIL